MMLRALSSKGRLRSQSWRRRFFHDEKKGDGEFITLEGEIDCGFGVKLPKSRSWFMNQDRRYLGKDTITACQVERP